MKFVASLKQLKNLWKTLDIQLINCEINVILTWSEICVIANKTTKNADPYADPAITAVNNSITNCALLSTCKTEISDLFKQTNSTKFETECIKSSL